MNIKRAKEEIKNTIQAYLLKDEYGEYEIPVNAQRPVFLIGAPGIGKTQIMEQIARECRIGLVSYTITHHTRQSAIGLPFISKKEFDGKEKAVTEYTMSEIVASVYEKIQETGVREGILFIDRGDKDFAEKTEEQFKRRAQRTAEKAKLKAAKAARIAAKIAAKENKKNK